MYEKLKQVEELKLKLDRLRPFTEKKGRWSRDVTTRLIFHDIYNW